MFRQTGNSDAGPSATGEVLVTGGGSGPGSNVTIVGPLGQAPMATSIPVVVASDQSPIVAATATVTSVNDTASSTTLLALNTSRRGASIFNDSTEVLYVKLGTTASLTDFTVKMLAGAYYELPIPNIYTGRIDGIWANNSSGAARVTELT